MQHHTHKSLTLSLRDTLSTTQSVPFRSHLAMEQTVQAPRLLRSENSLVKFVCCIHMQAVTPGTLWGVDRVTFRNVVVASTAERRARFEGALAAMPIFSSLGAEQRAAIAVR